MYLAVRKRDGQEFVLKRTRDKAGCLRMRREIDVQRSVEHPHIMPVIDWDRTDFSWYVMPKGIRTMVDLERPLSQRLIAEIADAVASALEAAHTAGYPHRDVKPQNIIELPGEGAPRWVLADWGLTRRPLGATTTGLTKTEQMLGTEGFAPPESYREAHLSGEAGDIFSLGQVIAWATGEIPVPNQSGTAREPWKALVEGMTMLVPEERLQELEKIRAALRVLSVPDQLR